MKIRFALAALCVGLFGAVAGTGYAATATNAPAAKTNAPAKPSVSVATNAPVPIEIAVSKFTVPTTTAEGRDPFFPNSARFSASVAPVNPGSKKTAPVTLVLQGISGKFALINGRTLEVNEEADISTSGGKIHVRCLNIGEDVVTVEANGARQELRLKGGL